MMISDGCPASIHESSKSVDLQATVFGESHRSRDGVWRVCGGQTTKRCMCLLARAALWVHHLRGCDAPRCVRCRCVSPTRRGSRQARSKEQEPAAGIGGLTSSLAVSAVALAQPDVDWMHRPARLILILPCRAQANRPITIPACESQEEVDTTLCV